jgi:PAS domain-containing protein
MKRALIELGFRDAAETAIGATIVKKEYEKIVADDGRSVVISSCCHSVNLIVQKYFPEALPMLAPVVSPMRAHCAEIKREHPDAWTVFIGPCVSKKAEAELYPGTVDCVITFGELESWFASSGISPEVSGADTTETSGRARIFPVRGGILRSMTEKRPDYSYVAVDGAGKCIEAIKSVISGGMKNCFIEMSACSDSCVGGPAMLRADRSAVRDCVTVGRFAGERDFDVPQPEKYHVGQDFKAMPVRKIFPGQKAIEDTLRAMGKKRPEDELNCGGCGYDTCRDKAAAVLRGKADIAMCLPYLQEKTQSFSDNIINNTPNGVIVLDESLSIQQINAAACKILNIRNESDVKGVNVSCVLDPMPMIDAVERGENMYEKRTYLIDYKKYVMQTVIRDASFNIIIVLMRDVTEEELGRSRKLEICSESIKITDSVIEHQMRTVQEIASLLGETAAETQIALTSLKETIQNERFLY